MLTLISLKRKMPQAELTNPGPWEGGEITSGQWWVWCLTAVMIGKLTDRDSRWLARNQPTGRGTQTKNYFLLNSSLAVYDRPMAMPHMMPERRPGTTTFG